MALERLVVPIEWKATDDDHILEGYASTFGNVDLGDDVVVKGAFLKTIPRIKSEGIPLLADHMPRTASVLGTIVDAKETDKGLWIKARLSKAPSAEDVRIKMAEGHVNRLSIGYESMDDAYEDRDGRRVRLLKEIKLWETSAVVFPMNTEAVISTVKSALNALAPADRRKLVDEIADDTGAEELKTTANETRELLHSSLRDLFKGAKQYPYLRDYDGEKVWYELWGDGAEGGIFERGYELDTEMRVKFADMETEVRAVIQYMPVNGDESKSTTLTLGGTLETSTGDEPVGPGGEPGVEADSPTATATGEVADPPDEGVKGWDPWASGALLAGRDPEAVTQPGKRAWLEETLRLLEADLAQR